MHFLLDIWAISLSLNWRIPVDTSGYNEPWWTRHFIWKVFGREGHCHNMQRYVAGQKYNVRQNNTDLTDTHTDLSTQGQKQMNPFSGCCLIKSRHVYSLQLCQDVHFIGQRLLKLDFFYRRGSKLEFCRALSSSPIAMSFCKRLHCLEILLILLFFLASNPCSS